MRLSSSRLTAIAQRSPLDFPLWNLAGTRPSLDLQFADRRDLVDATTGSNLVDFTRASSGTYVGSDGLIKTATTNEARFDHNPTTGESLGLLVEESRTNLLLSSEEFNAASWTASSLTITPNDTIAPDGNQTADKWQNTSTTGIIAQSIAKAASATTYTASVWIKSTDATSFSLTIDDGVTVNRGRCVFDLTTGVLSSSLNDGNFTNTSGTITPYPSSWYRITVTTTTNTQTTVRFRAFFSGNGGIAYIWGAQLEAASFSTSYIPTTSSTVTRAADVASISGSNFSSWYRQDEGTVFSNWRSSEANNFSIVEISNGTASSRIINFVDGSNVLRHRVAVSSVNSFNGADSYTAGIFNRTALGYRTNDHGGTNNGDTVVTSNSGGVPTVNTLVVGGISSGNFELNGTIRRLCFWPTRLPNETLQTITQ
jgi:hypothetical protein